MENIETQKEIQSRQNKILELSKTIENIIKTKTRNAEYIESILDQLLELNKSYDNEIKELFELLLSYYSFMNPRAADDFRISFADEYYGNKESKMSFDDLKGLLLEDDILMQMKNNEEEIFALIPELRYTKGFRTMSQWSAYDQYDHILNTLDMTENNLCLRLAAIFHGIGIPYVYRVDNTGVEYLNGHEKASIEFFNSYKDKLNLTEKESELVQSLIRYCDCNLEYLSREESKKIVREVKEENLSLLYELIQANLIAQSRGLSELAPKVGCEVKINMK